MLTQLYIKNFTIIDEAVIDFHQGLTVLTGETGAGKSILIDALQLLLGDRAEISLIKNERDRCEISAIFEVPDHSSAQVWLKDQAMDEGQTCLIRRVISRDAPSRNSINGRPCTLQAIRELSDFLIHIHGQNQHQQLLKNDYQRTLLDDYAQHVDLCQKVRHCYQKWQKAYDFLAEIESNASAHQQDFLAFQINELNILNVEPDELKQLDTEHKRLAHAEQWIATYEQTLQLLSEQDDSVLYELNKAQLSLKNLPVQSAISALLEEASIQVEEAARQIRDGLKKSEVNPERLAWLEKRLTAIHDMARKYKVNPEELCARHQQLLAQYQQIEKSAEKINTLKQQITQLTDEYTICAEKLTQSRQKAAQRFSKAITAQINTLGMPVGHIDIQLIARQTSKTPLTSTQEIGGIHGHERIEFLVATNPQQTPAPLNKVVSGGELSRIALAIQVVAAQTATLPTLIFDEVDVGIGGGVAETVGLQLKQLGKHAQVICVTHLPQVAALGHQHLRVEKQHLDNVVKTGIHVLSVEEKIQEIARMLGGVKLTDKTLAHAQEMVKNSEILVSKQHN